MKKITLLGVLLLSLLFAVNTGQAGYEPISRNVCALAVHPYNALAEGANILDPTKSSAWQNIFKQGTPECDNHVIYPNPYTPYPVTEQAAPPLAWPGDTSKSIPETIHLHKYFNDSIQDSKYYKSFTDSFQIYLEVDALENSDLSKLVCYTPGENNTVRTTPGCNGTLTDWGGTEITFNSTTGLINWKFATSGSGRPRLYGINPGLHGKTGVLNTNNENNRKLEFGVKLVSKNNANKKIWSATTTSRTLVRDQGINTANANAVTNPDDIPACTGDGTTLSTYDYSKWCTLPDSAIEASTKIEQKNVVGYNANGKTYITNGKFYYWKQIGPVATIWRNVTPPPPSLLACADLKWDGAFKKPSMMGIYMADTVNPNALLPNEKAIMKFQTIYENGTGTKRPLEYRWVAFYGEQSRPAWFKNDDTLSGLIQQISPSLKPMTEALLQSSLPGKLLKVAHAAPSLGSSASISSSILPSATETPTVGSLLTTGGSASLSPIPSELMAESSPVLDAFVMIGNFKDEISAVLSGNPLTDDDNQVFYSGGSEGVTVGVQAFYADGKNIPGDGPLVSTPDGMKQKANPCHLELVIQPKPVTCIDLEISPKTLEANTPVTFTVTPKFNPANKSLPLNYRWSAERYTSIIGNLNLGNGILGAFLEKDPNDIQYIPGAIEKDTQNLTWVGNGIHDVIQTGGGLADLTDPCLWGNCNQVEPSPIPLTPGDPIDLTEFGALAGQASSGLTTSGSNQFLGTNIFADFGSPADYGQTAVFNAGSLYSSKSTIRTADLKKAADIAVMPIALSHGGFKDTQTSPGLGANPYLETTDNKTYYTGGPENTLIKVQAEGKDGTLYPACSEKLVIPPVPGSICELLKVNFYENGTLVRKEQMAADKTYTIKIDQANSVRDDGTPITKYSIVAYNPAGVGRLTAATTNAASCTPISTIPVINPGAEIAARGTQVPTSVDCQYLYTPNAGDKITLLADPHDNVAACRLEQIIPGATNICELLKVNFYENGTLVRKEQMAADKTYTIEIDQANSVRDDDTPITKYSIVAYNPAGVGRLTAATTNAASCTPISTIPVINPGAEIAARGTQVPTSVDCQYLYTPNAGDKITLLADPHDNVAACRVDQTVPSVPTGPICKSLNLQTSPTLTGNEIAQGQIVTFASNPIDTEDKPRPPVVYSETGNGYFVANPNNAPVPDCPAVPTSGTFEAASSCRYSYQAPNDGTAATVTIKVKQDDGVAECLEEFIVKPTKKEEEICLALNLRVNGQYTLSPEIEAGQSYNLMVEPITTLGKPISMVEWTENGDGKLIGNPSNPGICPAVIDNGAVSTLSICQYIFASAPNAQNIGFSVRAVPDDNVAACKAAAQNYQPPVIPPYCLYLDLDYTPEPFQTGLPTNMNATVVMSDGSEYRTQTGGQNFVRFTSTNGAGRFSGGYANTSGSNTADFRTQTDTTNNTRNVTYQNGTTQSGINVFLSDTNVRMSASCMRQLRPVPVVTPPCLEPPTIEKKDGNRYCAEDGDSQSYCWTIDGPNNDLLFTNGRNTTTGDCVELNDNYERFELLVEDCNPEFKDFCFDTLTNDETPKTPTIEKRISKDTTPLRYTTAVHFSTTGASSAAPQTETVEYKLEYTPANFEGDNNTMTARIYDPAFSGSIRGVKTSVDGAKSDGGTITFDLSPNGKAISIPGYTYCSGSVSPRDKCFTIVRSEPNNSYLQIQGINSTETIVITYKGTLKSDITIDDCREGVWCNEEFKNQSRVEDLQYCIEEEIDGTFTTVCKPISPQAPVIYSNTTIADVVCAYFLTRASGDVFLEDELTYGIDVSKCYPFKNVSSVIVKPIEGEQGGLAATGTTPTVVSISHEICSAGQSEDPFSSLNLGEAEIAALSKLFGSEISKLSSQICEVGLVPGSDWNKENIATAMTQNIGKLTRWSSVNKPANQIYDFNDLKQASLGRVYYYKGTSPNETVTINALQIPDGDGTYTIIVEDADLQINGNIEYIEGTAQTIQEIASLGVIVLNGNMYVAPDVEKLAGAYFVQRTGTANSDGYYEKGNILSGSKGDTDEDSQTQLTINGSIYGNIGPLWSKRIAAGDITKDEGSVTIRYDQRIIQNPPAGLTDLLGTFSQTQIAQ